MTNHSPQANCLAIVQNFSNFWGDCLNLTLLIKKGVLSTFQIFIVIDKDSGKGDGGDHWEGKFTLFFENLLITHIRNYFSLEYSLILLFSY